MKEAEPKAPPARWPAGRDRRQPHGSAPAAGIGENLDADEQRARRQKGDADRAVDEDFQAAARQQQGAAQVLLEAGAEHEAQQYRRRVEAELKQDIADDAENQRLADLIEIAVRCVDAQADEENGDRVQVLVGNGQQLHPDPDHGHVEDHQKDVPDPEAGDQAPEDIRVIVDQLRAGLNALDDERAQQQCHHGIAGDAEAHGRDEVPLNRGMGRSLRTGDAFDRAMAKSFRMTREAFFRRVGNERRDGRTRARNHRA